MLDGVRGLNFPIGTKGERLRAFLPTPSDMEQKEQGQSWGKKNCQ